MVTLLEAYRIVKSSSTRTSNGIISISIGSGNSRGASSTHYAVLKPPHRKGGVRGTFGSLGQLKYAFLSNEVTNRHRTPCTYMETPVMK